MTDQDTTQGAIFKAYVETRDMMDSCNGVLLDVQPDDNDPAEFTHFDCWIKNEDGEDDDNGLTRYCDADLDTLAPIAADIIQSWENTLSLDLLSAYSEDLNEDLTSTITRLGIDAAFDLVIMKLLRAGYHVYEGDSFIEIYAD